MRFRFLSAMRWRAFERDIESPTVPLCPSYTSAKVKQELCGLDVNESACFNCYQHKVMCAAEPGIFVYLVRRRFGGSCTCAFRHFDNVRGSVRIRHGDIPS